MNLCPKVKTSRSVSRDKLQKEGMSRERSFFTTRGRNELRCICGSLLARVIPEGVELKCRKCKRHIILPIEGDGKAEIGTKF